VVKLFKTMPDTWITKPHALLLRDGKLTTV
jgi:hypothetical protein